MSREKIVTELVIKFVKFLIGEVTADNSPEKHASKLLSYTIGFIFMQIVLENLGWCFSDHRGFDLCDHSISFIK